MSKVIIIGAGGVGNVVAQKCAQLANDFTEIVLASRTIAKCEAISYTTGVPAMIGAQMIPKGLWKEPGVWNIEQLDPDPFMQELNPRGLP